MKWLKRKRKRSRHSTSINLFVVLGMELIQSPVSSKAKRRKSLNISINSSKNNEVPVERFYVKNSNPNFWKKERVECNCGGFALNTPSWVCPYDNDAEYTDESRTQMIRDMYEEGFSKEAIMEAIITLDQESLLRSCSWIEPVLPEEISPNDRIVAYRLFLDETALEFGIVEEDYHFRVRINGFWFEKCGHDPIRFCGTKLEEGPWITTPFLIYDSDICYFRFKEI